jgi:PAS domain S-box-containing protein
MPLKARVYIGVVIGLGGIAFVYGLHGWVPHDVFRFLCYLALAIPASCLKVWLPGVTGTMSVLFMFLLAGVVELELAETVIAGVLCVIAQSFWRPKKQPRAVQVFFSMADIVLSVTATWFLYRAFPTLPSPFRLALAACAFFVVNTFPIAVVITLTEGNSLRNVWSKCYFWCFPYYLAGAAIVGVLSFANSMLDWKSAVLIIPVVYTIYRSYVLYLNQLHGERHRAAEEHRYAEEQHRHAAEIAGLQARTMEALTASLAAKARLDAVIRASPLAIVALDNRGDVTAWNTTAEHMLGWSAREVTGRPLPFSVGTSEGLLENIVGRTLRGEAIAGVEMKQWRKDGTAFDAAIWTAALQEGNEPSGVLVTVADVSDRKRLEEQLRLSNKLEAIGRLAGGIAHDFNNLLTIINGYSALLADNLSEHLEEKNQAQEILGAGTRAAELVAQLLTFSRRQVIEPKPLEVIRFVRGVERMLERIIGEHIELRNELHEDAGWINVDRNQMEGVLLNLATNARDAMPDGGVLTIEAARVEIGADTYNPHRELAAGSYVCLTVRDTGSGMNAETQQRLFEPFFSTKPRGKGTGLGLSSVYGVVEQNGGWIFVSSELGSGSSFSIYFPRVEPVPSPEPVITPSGRVNRGSETILLVEDETAVRYMLRDALNNAGYRVWEACHGADAIEHWAPSIDRIDLVVTDIVMPVMNGVRLIEELRKRRPGIKVICMSGHSEDILNRQRELDPAPELLRKPFLPAALVRRVREVLDAPAARNGFRSRSSYE